MHYNVSMAEKGKGKMFLSDFTHVVSSLKNM